MSHGLQVAELVVLGRKTSGKYHRSVREWGSRANMMNRIELAKWMRRLKPSVVIGFGDKTPMASADHWQAMQITDGAIFFSRLSKWEDRFGGLPTHRVRRHLYFRLAVEPDSIPWLSHHITVDISDTIKKKLDSIECYRTQFEHKDGFVDRVEAAARVTGSAAGVKYGESFAAATPFAVNDLVSTVLGPSTR